MKTVNFYLLRSLIDRFGGLPDEEITILMEINPNDEAALKNLFQKYVMPEFSLYGPKSKEICKNTLQFLLATQDEANARGLLVVTQIIFDDPDQPLLLFRWLWEELFGNEPYKPINEKEYVIHNDFHAPNLAYNR